MFLDTTGSTAVFRRCTGKLHGKFSSADPEDPPFQPRFARFWQAERRFEVVIEGAAPIHLSEPGGDAEGVVLVVGPIFLGVATTKERRIHLRDRRLPFRHVETIERPEMDA